MLSRLPSAWLCSVANPRVPPGCPLPSPQRERKESREPVTATVVRAQREVMSLSALSSSSLMALYFIFCA